jgi:outer membrane protein assembly factor BamB
MNGQTQWQVDNGPAWTKDYPGTRGTPTIDGDRLYHQSPIGNIVCLKAQTGEKIWGINSLETFGGKNIQWALSESLLIDGDRVICCPGGSEASVAALDKMTGETIWKAESTGDKAGYSTPTLAEHSGLRMIFVMTAKSVIGVNADTGKLLFRHPFETKYDVNVLKPIFHDGHLFVSGGYGTTGSQMLKVIAVDGEDVSVELVWESKDLDNHHGGVVLLDGFLYGAAHQFNNAKWACLDWETGEQKWAERGIGKGSVTYADGMLYMMNEKSSVGLAKPSPDGHEVISKFRLPPGGSGPSWAHPVVCGGRLYIRHADRLFAFDVQG